MGISIRPVIRSGFWLYMVFVISNAFGFIYWLVLSLIGGSAILGITSATVGVFSLVTGLLSLGVGVGLQRYLGKFLSANDVESARKYFWSSMFLLLTLSLSSGSVLMFLGLYGFSIGSIRPMMLVVAGFMVMLGFTIIFRAFLIASLRTDIQALSATIGNLLKLCIGVSLVLLGFGWVGASVGYIFVNISMLFIGGYFVIKHLGFKLTFDVDAIKNVLRAGVVNWFPSIIVIIGQWLGVLAVFGYVGAVETGHYYVAFAISNFVTMISLSPVRLLIPVLSGMSDGRKRFGWRVFRLSIAIMVPVAAFLATYPWLPLSLLGKEFVEASSALTVLLLGAVPVSLSTSVISLLYAYDRYLDILLIGLFQNVPRVVLYTILTPKYGGLGSAYAFTIGSFIGLTYTAIASYKVGLIINLRELGIIVGIPAALALTCHYLGIPWFMALPAFVATYLAYIRLGAVTRADLKELATAFVSEEKVRKFYRRLRPLIDIVM